MYWTIDEKKNLLMLLQEHGSSNLEIIQQKMPSKSITEIRAICQKHRTLALNKWLNAKEGKYEKYDSMKHWLDVLKSLNSHRPGSVRDIIPRVLKYIALYEKRTKTAHINLKDCYLVLSDGSNGVASKKLDDISQYFLFQCLTKLAQTLKNGEIESYKSHLRSLDSFRELLDITRNNTVLNPLRVPKNLLKMTEVDKHIDVFEDAMNVKSDLNNTLLRLH